MNLRPLGYEPSELPNCSTPRRCPFTVGGRRGARQIDRPAPPGPTAQAGKVKGCQVWARERKDTQVGTLAPC